MRLLTALLLCLSTPAWSLSCLPSDAVAAYKAAEESPDVWMVVQGVLSFDERRLPAGSASNPDPEGRTIVAVLDGRSLSSAGFKNRFAERVELEVSCAASWCGSAQSGGRYLAFLKREGPKFIAFAGACGGHLFLNPTKQDLRKMTTCFNGGRCVPQQF